MPQLYNGATIRIDPWALYTSATAMLATSSAIASDLEDIMGRLNSLTWTGDSAEQARAVIDKVLSAAIDVFGSDGSGGTSKSDGVLSMYLDALSHVASLWPQYEQQLVKEWTDFGTVLGGGTVPDTGGGKTPQPGDLPFSPFQITGIG